MGFVARELVLLGGGHSHVLVLRMLAMAPIPGLQVTLISPDVETPYSGMLPGMIAGHYSAADMHIDLVPLCRFAGARFVQASAYHIDPHGQRVACTGRPDIGYDVLSIDIGITPALLEVPGAAGNVIAVKPISQFLQQWQACLVRLQAGTASRIGVVGGGAGGVELCLAIHHYLTSGQCPGVDPASLEFHLLVDQDSLLPGYSAGVRALFTQVLADRGIHLQRQFRVTEVAQRTLTASSGEQLALDEIFWVTSAAAQSWLAETDLPTDAQGFLEVRETLQVCNFDNVFAVGDTAHVLAHPRPKAGVYAVRQGPALFANIRRQLLGQALQAFVPQQAFLSLLSTGDKAAVAVKYGLHVHGALAWRWKDWIDRRFMRLFSDLPAMTTARGTGLLADVDSQMQCGGCGAKVSADLLQGVLAKLNLAVASLDDAALYRVPANQLMLHTVDVFKAFVDDPYRLARIGVNHALSDIYAMGGTPVTALAIVTTPYGREAATRNLLEQLMQGAVDQLAAEAVALVGGHTTEGAELSIGFAVNGVVDEARLLPKAGMRPGQLLVLTKPLGTGTLFAADMQHLAKGRWIVAALDMMEQSNAAAARVFATFEAGQVSACTDITGFGLGGHLQEMMLASNVNVRLDLDRLPVLEGALTCLLDLGLRSTLHAGNQRSVTVLRSTGQRLEPLLFDPQTAGGLLASVAAAQAPALLRQLHAAGYHSAGVIGEVLQSAPMGDARLFLGTPAAVTS